MPMSLRLFPTCFFSTCFPIRDLFSHTGPYFLYLRSFVHAHFLYAAVPFRRLLLPFLAWTPSSPGRMLCLTAVYSVPDRCCRPSAWQTEKYRAVIGTNNCLHSACRR